MKIGFIQTGGLGDVVIAAPIAQCYIEQGHDVYWPIDSCYYRCAQMAFPEINFLEIVRSKTGFMTAEYFVGGPYVMLTELGCEQIFSLYSYLTGMSIANEGLARSLKFDEYKYAVTGVSFDRKWRLKIMRHPEREQALFDQLEIERKYVLIHDQGSTFKLNIQLPDEIVRTHQVVRVSELSENPFDWLMAFERASMVVCVDSCFANLVEQLNFSMTKFLYLRSNVASTPVFKNGWLFRYQQVE